LNLSALYNKFSFIRQNSGRNSTGTVPFLVQLLTSIRNVNGAYTKTEGTYLPGYLPSTNVLGYDFNSNAPGWGFLFGGQGDILDKAARNGWLSSDTLQTNMYTKTFAENISVVANLEPIKGLRVDLTMSRIDNYNLTSAIQFNATTGQLESASPYVTGNYTVSQIAIRTSFKNSDALFQKFEEHRQAISQRLGEKNINSVGQSADFYADGYSKTQQDVVVNAFLATYLGKDADQAKQGIKPTFPLPNWRISYNALANVLGIQDFISSININHAYQSQYIIGGYTSTARYEEADGMPFARDANQNFLPKNQYGQISIIDRFVPLIGVDMRFANALSVNSEYRKTRDMNMSLQNSQLAMMTEQSFIVGMGLRKNNIRLPFGIFEDRKWVNDMNFRVDFALNDRKTTVYRSDINQAEISGGNKSLTINPSLDYTVNQFYNIRLFYNSNAVKPYTSQNYATSYTYFGINIRIQFQ
jgi:cell surface protein SprA